MYGLFLIMVLVVTGGAIAFIGDRLGSRVGKKKLTMFGLRPKYTSILVTILTGISITTVTLAVMTTVSENVRTALFGMEQLRYSMAETENRLLMLPRNWKIPRQSRPRRLRRWLRPASIWISLWNNVVSWSRGQMSCKGAMMPWRQPRLS